MSKPKPKRKFAACGACRGKGLVWVNRQGQQITAGAAFDSKMDRMAYCTCELGEAKRMAAEKARKPWER